MAMVVGIMGDSVVLIANHVGDWFANETLHQQPLTETFLLQVVQGTLITQMLVKAQPLLQVLL